MIFFISWAFFLFYVLKKSMLHKPQINIVSTSLSEYNRKIQMKRELVKNYENRTITFSLKICLFALAVCEDIIWNTVLNNSIDNPVIMNLFTYLPNTRFITPGFLVIGWQHSHKMSVSRRREIVFNSLSNNYIGS